MRSGALSISLALRQAIIRTSAIIGSDQKRISFYFPADPDTIDTPVRGKTSSGSHQKRGTMFAGHVPRSFHRALELISAEPNCFG